MLKTLTMLLLALAAGTAQAQIKCWTDANGKRTCGDTPPAGAKVTTLKNPASGPAPAPASKDAKEDVKKGPLTPAEQEQEYRKRRAEADKASAQADKDKAAADVKRENCERAREYMNTLDSGQRIPRTDAKGERYYLDDKQMDAEKARAAQAVQQSCS